MIYHRSIGVWIYTCENKERYENGQAAAEPGRS